MNKQERDILSTLVSEPYSGQRMLAEVSGHSLGVVNRSLKNLKNEGYLDEQMRLTEKAKHEFKEKAPRNAVILADGFGMRITPDNAEIPMGLLKVRGEPLVERIIKQLHEVGIREICVIVGFRKEQYESLIDMYGVKLIVNSDYAKEDSLCSIRLVLPFLSNTYMIPCNIWCSHNPFHSHELYSWYMVSDSMDNNSNIRVNRKMELVTIPCQTEGNAVIGIAYLLEEQAVVIKERAAQINKGDCHEYMGKAWERVLFEEDKMMIPARMVHGTNAVKIHTLEQLHRLDDISGRKDADALAICGRFLGYRPEKIVDAASLKKNTMDRTFLFSGKGRKYTMWMPGDDMDRLVIPGREKQVYASIMGKKLCEDPIYISSENGCRITRFLDGVRSCDPMDVGDLEKCMAFLRHFHGMGLIVDHETDIFGMAAFYENLWDGKQSLYKDYAETKANVQLLKPYIDSLTMEKSLTHMDAVPEKFLFINDSGDRGEGGSKVQLVGWEYAGMQDPHVDIAMFCTASLYDREWVDKLISIYFEGKCPDETRIKIYCYIAVCGLVRSNWCEYKMKQGIEFGEYSLRQYRYAKEYYRIVEKETKRLCAVGLFQP